MTIVLSTPPYQQFYDDNGDPLSGGLIYTYAAGTNTPQATYTNQGGGTPSANPIVLDSAGRAEFWLDSTLSYKYVIKTSLGTTIRTIDNVTPFFANTGTASLGAVTATNINLTGSTIPANGVYLPSANVLALSSNSLLSMSFISDTSAVNSAVWHATSAGTDPYFVSTGAATDIGFRIITKGTGAVTLVSGQGTRFLASFTDVASSANYFTFATSATGNNPTISVTGSDANRDFVTVAKGTGVLVNLGSYTNTTATAANVNIDASGLIKRVSSSIKYKKDVVDYDKGLELIDSLRPVWYKSKDESDERQYAGFVAEEMDALGMKEFVIYDNKTNEPEGFAYGNLTAYLVNCVKQLKAELNELKSSIKGA